MSPLAVILPPTGTRDSCPAPMWPYITMCFASIACVFAAAVFVGLHWSLKSPLAAGVLGASISIVIPAWFFFRRFHRRFVPQERWRFFMGCFLAFWFYDEFLRIALMVAHREATTKEIVTAILATLVDFVLVGIIVVAIDLWAARAYGSAETPAPSNNRWRGP